MAKIILGLLQPAAGQVKLNVLPPAIGYLEQKTNPPVIMPVNAFEVARMGLLGLRRGAHKFNKADDNAARAALAAAGANDLAGKLFNQLSGGQQQRVLLARAIANNPKLLILDEPSTALDCDARESFFKLIKHLNQTHNTTILLITHDNAEVSKYVNNFLVLDKTIIYHGAKPPTEAQSGYH